MFNIPSNTLYNEEKNKFNIKKRTEVRTVRRYRVASLQITKCNPYHIDFRTRSQWVLTGEQSRRDNDTNKDEVTHDRVALQPVTEYTQTVILDKDIKI